MARDLLSGRERSNQILEVKSKMSLLSGVVVPEPRVIEALARGDGAAAVAQLGINSPKHGGRTKMFGTLRPM